ncbi:MAG: ATP-binding protein [Nannocystis sp.]|nr:ATP-binding protein [Nannocystis sp.]
MLRGRLGRVTARRREHHRAPHRQQRHPGPQGPRTLDWAFQPKLSRTAIEEIAGLGFITRRQDLLITGKGGTGKSHIPTAIAIRAKYLGDATITAAVLDRLAMTAIRLDIDGPSYRQHLAHQRAESVESDPELDAA